MKITSILSFTQQNFLRLFSKNKSISNFFYLTEGTALCAFYLPYRLSEDLDFFSEKEFDLLPISTFLKSVKGDLEYKSIDINTSFNRNVVQLIFEKEVLKTEFTFFPFPQIERPKINGGVKVDSLVDIATNKLFTIYQSPRTRDFIDLYMICKAERFTMPELIKKAKAKFDWHVDPIKLGSQFLLFQSLKDYPRLIKKIEDGPWQEFFRQEAKKLEKNIFTA